jgi:hypothetical protein
MKNTGIRGLFIVAAASVLTACAAQAPVNPASLTPAAAPGAPPSASAIVTEKVPSGYRRVVKNDVEYFCSREAITGSRTSTIQQCLTKAQLTAIRERDQDFVRRQQNHVGKQFEPSGTYPSPFVSAASPP